MAGPEALANPEDWYVPRERLRGWRDALEPVGISPVLRYVEKTAAEQGFAAARALLAGPERPTAVLAFSDALAADVLRAADDLRLRVPADLSVIGFDDSPLASRVTPALTTVRQDVVAKGTAAAAELVAAVRARRAGRRGAGPAPGAGHRAGAAGDDGAARRRRAGNERHLRRLGPYEGADRPVSGGGRTRGGWRRSRRDAARLPRGPASAKKVTSSGPSDRPARCSSRAIANRYGGDDGGDDVLLETVVTQGFRCRSRPGVGSATAMTTVSLERVPGAGRRRTGGDGSTREGEQCRCWTGCRASGGGTP